MSLLWFILDVVLVVDIFVFIAYYWWKSHQVILCCCPTWLSLWWGEYLQKTWILLFYRSANNLALFYAILLQTTLSQSVYRSSNDSLLYIFSDPDDRISFMIKVWPTSRIDRSSCPIDLRLRLQPRSTPWQRPNSWHSYCCYFDSIGRLTLIT